MKLREQAQTIIDRALEAAQPKTAVQKALSDWNLAPFKNLYIVAVGKAAWSMGEAALSAIDRPIKGGVVITKHDHSMGDLSPLQVYEAGHPVPDQDTLTATQAALKLVEGLTEKDAVLFLVSGGGSALFEDSVVALDELQSITKQMLAKGMNIVEMNTIRKRLSRVKGGRFAEKCAPAKVFSIVLSDIIGDPLDMIASGPAYPDQSTSEDALSYVQKYGLELSHEAQEALKVETPKTLSNVETKITGSVRELCQSAIAAAQELGYETIFLTDRLDCVAREAGAFLGAIAQSRQDTEKPLAFIAGGETIVHLKGKGMGGRNQELALSAIKALSQCKNTCLFSLGSDGTDGPTDAAGGYVDENTLSKLEKAGISYEAVLDDNDAYNGLKAVDGLIMTGPTGTNVNDVTVLLINR